MVKTLAVLSKGLGHASLVLLIMLANSSHRSPDLSSSVVVFPTASVYPVEAPEMWEGEGGISAGGF